MIERNRIEDWMSLNEARELVDKFFSNQSTYPDHEFYSHKRGIYKDIPEEYFPLLLLAEHISGVTSLRLSPDSLPGPDGKLRIEDASEITVQVTVSHERNGGYKERQELRDTGLSISKCQTTDDIIADRLNRIIEAIEDKENKFREGTDVLLIVDKSIFWGDEIDPGLSNAIKEAIEELPSSKYSATYVVFGTDVRKVR